MEGSWLAVERLGAALRFVPWDFCCWRGLSLGGHLRRSYHLQVCKESQGMLETVARSQPMALSTPSAQPALLLPPGCEARRGGRRSAESGFLDVCRNGHLYRYCCQDEGRRRRRKRKRSIKVISHANTIVIDSSLLELYEATYWPRLVAFAAAYYEEMSLSVV